MVGPLRVALVCGGPSLERGISLNSARSVLDHLQSDTVNVIPFYVDLDQQAHAISPAQLYSNTPSDFDFRLRRGELGDAEGMSMEAFMDELRRVSDLVMPVMHGQFGEDGGFQALLEAAGLPFVGTGAAEACRAFDKASAAATLASLALPTLPSLLLHSPPSAPMEGGQAQAQVASIERWFAEEGLDPARGCVVVKPARGGSSIGVSVAGGVEACGRAAAGLQAAGSERVVVERFADGGMEFTLVVVQGPRGPVPLLPSEVVVRQPAAAAASSSDAGAEAPAIFDFRRKYLPTQQVRYHTPPRVAAAVLERVRAQGAQLFAALGLRDYARLDGWILPAAAACLRRPPPALPPASEPHIVFSDINIVSGMEQTSFLFQQAAEVGLSHAAVLRAVLASACARHALPLPPAPPPPRAPAPLLQDPAEGADSADAPSRTVRVLFGGGSSERQVSLMSGTNVWLKLAECSDLAVEPYLLAPSQPAAGVSAGACPAPAQPLQANGAAGRAGADEDAGGAGVAGDGGDCGDRAEGDVGDLCVWRLPYAAVLKHTVEEVLEGCENVLSDEMTAATQQVRRDVADALGVEHRGGEGSLGCWAGRARKMPLREFASSAAAEGAVVFVALHGGPGEDGRVQALLEAQGVSFTGCGSACSRLCMDKAATGRQLAGLEAEGIRSAPKLTMATADLAAACLGPGPPGDDPWAGPWQRVLEGLGRPASVCIKPLSDGCSTGVAHLSCAADLAVYAAALANHAAYIPASMLSKPHGIIDLPSPRPRQMLFEPFIQTANAVVCRSSSGGEVLRWEGESAWVEVTVGVVGPKEALHALTPSITVRSSGDVLSLEDKFQGGTGVNLTPPPAELVGAGAMEGARRRIERVAAVLGIQGLSRIDAFLHVHTGEIIVIEANTVPGMTPSTVLFHQAVAEQPPLSPGMFLRSIVECAIKACRP